MPPPTRKFAVGDRVEISPGRSDPHVVAGTYTIVGLMPWQGTDYQYRVKHVRDQHERVVGEAGLRRA
jgi:hypothetical protein